MVLAVGTSPVDRTRDCGEYNLCHHWYYLCFQSSRSVSQQKGLEENNPSRVAAFMARASTFVRRVVESFGAFKFYIGHSHDLTAGVIASYYKEADPAPYLLYISDGLREERF
ncbi:unnamed protein product [Blepharisma stoltei]|uniref:TCTP domain-containing protein n=1 Tax=Blepharisma stoltei TaxID=1481888 RepID=A0AAU9JC85_9CILI|nr:unnamed protein product [Blepharisma stoltei]